MIEKAFAKIDNAPLIIFRILFGFVFFVEAVGALALGWVGHNFVNTTTNFTFIGFEKLLFLQNDSMYVVFALMALASIGVTIGYKYRLSIALLTILWGISYFGQKTSYNNHYYLMWLVSLIMCFLPANRYAAVDVKRNPSLKENFMPQWISWLFIIQISCVYFYATLAKFYPDWLDGTVTANMFLSMTEMPDGVKNLFQQKNFQLFIAYAGIAFDGLIVPALLWKRTRWFAIISSLIFHVFNSITLQIGVFPYFALSFCVFFFPASAVRNFFFRKKAKEVHKYASVFEGRLILKCFFIPYLIIQIVLPLRHWFIKGDVLWTDEGHRLSWRMMLRSRGGEVVYRVIDKKTNEIMRFHNDYLLTYKQQSRLNTPDVIWQMAQKIKEYYVFEGINVSVYAIDSYVYINEKAGARFVNPTIDLTAVDWNYFKHQDWVLEQNDLRVFHHDSEINRIPVQLKHQK